VSRSGLNSWKPRRDLEPSSDDLALVGLFLKARGTKGIRRLKMDFERRFQRPINHKKIKRIKRDFALITRVRKRSKFRAIFRKGEESKTSPNLVNRNFSNDRTRILTTDITELRYSFGQRAYLAAVKDLRTKEIVSFKVGLSPTIDLAEANLLKLLKKVPTKIRRRIFVHSDQGFQYTHDLYRKPLEELGVTLSMSRKGNCLDNAPIESFFGHLKDEVNLKDCKNFIELESEVKRYMDYYNNRRPQWGLERKTPAEAGVGISLVL
jgi:transposase InsO family protein